MQGFPLKKWWATQIVLLDPRIPRGASLLFTRLIEYHNTRTGRCYPSQRRLARDLGVEQRTIRNWISSLSKFGYVSLLPKGGRGGTNAYEIWLPSGKMEFKDAEKALQAIRKRRAAKPKD